MSFNDNIQETILRKKLEKFETSYVYIVMIYPSIVLKYCLNIEKPVFSEVIKVLRILNDGNCGEKVFYCFSVIRVKITFSFFFIRNSSSSVDTIYFNEQLN